MTILSTFNEMMKWFVLTAYNLSFRMHRPAPYRQVRIGGIASHCCVFEWNTSAVSSTVVGDCPKFEWSGHLPPAVGLQYASKAPRGKLSERKSIRSSLKRENWKRGNLVLELETSARPPTLDKKRKASNNHLSKPSEEHTVCTYHVNHILHDSYTRMASPNFHWNACVPVTC